MINQREHINNQTEVIMNYLSDENTQLIVTEY